MCFVARNYSYLAKEVIPKFLFNFKTNAICPSYYNIEFNI